MLNEKGVLAIQSFVRSMKARKNYLYSVRMSSSNSQYITYSKITINKCLYFVSLIKSKKKSSVIIGGLKSREVIVLEAYPLVSGVKLPMKSIYTYDEISWRFGF